MRSANIHWDSQAHRLYRFIDELTLATSKHMSPFKYRVLTAILVIVLPMANLASAGTSRSMKSGFSSQKSQSQRSSGSDSNKSSSTSFGSFGQQRGATSGRSDSALNRDLEKNQAQQQALKNLDARNQQKSATHPEQQSSVTGKPLSPVQSVPQIAPAVTPQASVAPTVIVQRESSSMGAAFMGFMLGQAISRPHTAPSYDTRRNDLEPIAGGDDASYKNSAVNEPAGSAVGAAKVPAVKPVESESIGWHMLRFMLWLTFLSGLAWVSFKLYRFFLPRRQELSHYSLGKV